MLAWGVTPLPLADLDVPERVAFDTLTPPPRFATTSFASYLPQHPSQAEGRRSVAEFVADDGQERAFRWPWQAPPVGRGLYLDGGFGVGKTHLLAAAYHASSAVAKVYLSFQELVYLIGMLGRERATATFGDRELYCIDEFELDDPGNTLIVKTFLAAVFARGARLVTTSNTPPEAQGRGRFNAEDFQREIQSIAGRFEVRRIDGPDYRRRNRLAQMPTHAAFEAGLERASGAAVLAGWQQLLAFMRRVHPIRYSGTFGPVDTLFVRDLTRLSDQNDALRFVHLIDKLYDLEVGFVACGEPTLDALFDDSYCRGAYAKKYDRCLSRLSELLDEGVRAVA